jgi:hypothetical protein
VLREKKDLVFGCFNCTNIITNNLRNCQFSIFFFFFPLFYPNKAITMPPSSTINTTANSYSLIWETYIPNPKKEIPNEEHSEQQLQHQQQHLPIQNKEEVKNNLSPNNNETITTESSTTTNNKQQKIKNNNNNTKKKKQTSNNNTEQQLNTTISKQQNNTTKNNDDNDDGGYFDIFGLDLDGGDDDEPTKLPETPTTTTTKPKKLKDDSCPWDGDIRGKHVTILYDGIKYGATIKSYEEDSNTYTITWLSSGVLQYRTPVTDIMWEEPTKELAELLETSKKTIINNNEKPRDELWLAARRGSLESVKKFIAEGIHFNETGKDQDRTPFYLAVHGGHVAVAEYLLNLGATDSDGTAFIAANKPEMRELLQRKGLTKTGSFSLSGVIKDENTTTTTTSAERRRSSANNKVNNNNHQQRTQISVGNHNINTVLNTSITTERKQSVTNRKQSIIKNSDIKSSTQQLQQQPLVKSDYNSIPKRKAVSIFSCFIPKLGGGNRKNKTTLKEMPAVTVTTTTIQQKQNVGT